MERLEKKEQLAVEKEAKVIARLQKKAHKLVAKADAADETASADGRVKSRKVHEEQSAAVTSTTPRTEADDAVAELEGAKAAAAARAETIAASRAEEAEKGPFRKRTLLSSKAELYAKQAIARATRMSSDTRSPTPDNAGSWKARTHRDFFESYWCSKGDSHQPLSPL